MPTYQYECPKHYFEYICPMSERQDSMPCKVKRCKRIAQQVIRPSWQVQANRFDPVVVHVDAKGNVRYPGNTKAPVPKGYERVELKTISDVRQFEKTVNRTMISDWQRHQEEKEQVRSQEVENNRRELRTMMESMSQRGRDFANYAMTHNNNRPRPRFDPNFHVEAFSMDKSNREPYNDSTTEWKRRY